MTYTANVTPEWNTEIKGRNPVLNGLKFDVYKFIKDNPGCTRGDVAKGCALKSSTATARVKELIDDGIVYSSKDRRKKDRSGVTVQTLYVSEDALHKRPKDKVLVRVSLKVDASGNYRAEAHVVGEAPRNRSISHTVMVKDVVLQAPYPSEYKHHFLGSGSVVPSSDTLSNVSLIVDSE